MDGSSAKDGVGKGHDATVGFRGDVACVFFSDVVPGTRAPAVQVVAPKSGDGADVFVLDGKRARARGEGDEEGEREDEGRREAQEQDDQEGVVRS